MSESLPPAWVTICSSCPVISAGNARKSASVISSDTGGLYTKVIVLPSGEERFSNFCHSKPVAIITVFPVLLKFSPKTVTESPRRTLFGETERTIGLFSVVVFITTGAITVTAGGGDATTEGVFAKESKISFALVWAPTYPVGT